MHNLCGSFLLVVTGHTDTLTSSISAATSGATQYTVLVTMTETSDCFKIAACQACFKVQWQCEVHQPGAVRLQVYYTTPANKTEVKGFWCHPCYQDHRGERIELDGTNVSSNGRPVATVMPMHVFSNICLSVYVYCMFVSHDLYGGMALGNITSVCCHRYVILMQQLCQYQLQSTCYFTQCMLSLHL